MMFQKKPRLNYWIILTTIFVLFSTILLGIMLSDKLQLNGLMTTKQESTYSMLMPTTSDNTKYRKGESISFAFSYPVGWSAYSAIIDRSGKNVEIFRLNPDPIWSFPEFTAFIEGEGRKSTSLADFDKAVENFQKKYKTKNLNWKTGDFRGSCFEYDFNSARWGEVKENIKCFIYIKSSKSRGFLGDYVLYIFNVHNGNGVIKTVDPNKSITKFIFENLKAVPNNK